MSTRNDSAPTKAGTVELDTPTDPGLVAGAPSSHLKAVDSASEVDYWHVNYMTRPYYKEGWSFGDYEAAYRYGWENALEGKEKTFEEIEKSHLASGWAEARGKTPHSWEEIREATRDAWTHARQSRKT
jgi:hypothetical protein